MPGTLLASSTFATDLDGWRSDAESGSTVTAGSGSMLLRTGSADAFAGGAIAYWSGQADLADGETRFVWTVPSNNDVRMYSAVQSTGSKVNQRLPYDGYVVDARPGGGSFALYRMSGGTQTTLQSGVPFAFPAAGQPWVIAIRRDGDRTRVALWALSAERPIDWTVDTWQIDVTEASPRTTAGKGHVFVANGSSANQREARLLEAATYTLVETGTGAPDPTVSIPGGTRSLVPFEEFTVTATTDQDTVTWSSTGPSLILLSDDGLSRTYRAPALFSGAATTLTATATNLDGERATASVQVNTLPHSEFADADSTLPIRVTATPSTTADASVFPMTLPLILAGGTTSEAEPEPEPEPDAFVLGATKPTAENSGSRVATTSTHVGDWRTSTLGTPTTGVRIEGRLIVDAPTVAADFSVVGKASLTATESYNLIETLGAGTDSTLEHVTVAPRATNQSTEGIRISAARTTVRRCSVVDVVDGIGLNAADPVVEGNYVDRLAYLTPCTYQNDNQTHNDAIQVQPGCTDPTVRGNNLVAKYGTAGTHQPNPAGGATPSGADNPVISCVMFGSNLGTGYTIGGAWEDNWMGGGYWPVNGGTATDADLGRFWRNKFDGDSLNGPEFDGGTYTLAFDATTTVDTGDSTPNQNAYEGTSTPVNVRRNQ